MFWFRSKGSIAAMVLAATACASCSNSEDADNNQRVTMHVIASASNSNLYEALEEGFWREEFPAASEGQIAVDMHSITESGLKGPEIARLLSAGALDIAYINFGAVAGDVRAFEGLDLSGVITDFDMLEIATDAYRPVLEQIFNQHRIKLLGLFPYPSYAFYCTGRVASLEDLAGKKVRVTTHSMADFMEPLGAVPIFIPFPDVVPALQTGVADCAVTGTYSGNKAGWHEITDSLFTLPVGSGIAFYGYSARGWNELDTATREFVEAEFERFENRAWEITREQSQDGINCNTGVGTCVGGTRSDMQLYLPSAADIARANEIAETVVLPNWAARCGDSCVAEWNATVGQVTGIQIR